MINFSMPAILPAGAVLFEKFVSRQDFKIFVVTNQDKRGVWLRKEEKRK